MTSSDPPPPPALTLAIAATFTAEPVEAALRFWMQELEIEAHIRFAPTGQVLQQLLDPTSLLSTNRHGVNVLMVRFGDWTVGDQNQEQHVDEIRLEQNVESLISAVGAARDGSATPFLVCLCPSASAIETGIHEVFKRVEVRTAAALEKVADVYVISASELLAAYPVAETFDVHGDKLAHIPFTPAFYIVLGTMIARKIYALRNAPYKVIAFDADQTLWSGVCGEDGARGVAIDRSRQAIQEFLREQGAAGRVLCLCSQNNDEDVAAVFDSRPEMVLHREQITGWRANWKPKSENLKALAGELQLGLESFIFLDDDPVACADVQANCPQVLTFVLPRRPETIAPFLRKLWAFDHLKVTAEGAGRTALYRQNAERQQFRKESSSLQDFLAGLRLKVDFSPPALQHLARLAELSQRTNQFNMTTVRHSEGELQALCRPDGQECLVVHVKDRFGDYGLVGAMIFAGSSGTLRVDELFLSCRALGRGVEHRMLARAGEIAVQRGLAEVAVRFVPSPKNQPALDFLSALANSSKEVVNDGIVFRIPAAFAATLRYDPPVAANIAALPGDNPVAAPAQVVFDGRVRAARLSAIANELSDVEQIRALIVAQTRVRPDSAEPFVPPLTECEKTLASLFAELLGIDQVGINDNFFSLGGHSLLATMLILRLRDAFGIELPITVLFEIDFTVAQLARTISERQKRQGDPQDLGAIVRQLESLSPDDVREMLAQPETPRAEEL